MRTISAMDLRKRLGETLDRAAAGERIVIERDRRPLAVIVPYSEATAGGTSAEERREQMRLALQQLDEYAERMRARHPGGPNAVEAVWSERDHGHGDHG